MGEETLPSDTIPPWVGFFIGATEARADKKEADLGHMEIKSANALLSLGVLSVWNPRNEKSN